MEGFANLDISNSSKLAYVAYKPNDVEIYKYLLKDWHGTGKRYDTVYTALKDIRAPSKEQARKIFENLYDNDPRYRKQLQGSLATAYLSLDKTGPQRSVAEKMAYARIYTQDKMKDPFAAASYSFVRQGKDTEKYRNALMKKGYSAIEDYFDKGQLAESPLILLDPKGTVSKKGETLVNRLDELGILKAQSLWYDLQIRQLRKK